MVRLFVTTSHLCTLYMLSYARNTNKGNYTDVLILDTPPKKKSLKKAITDTQKIYQWDSIIDLSTTLDDNADFEPNTRKSLTRKLKGKPIIKPVYDFLLKIYLKQQQNKEVKIIQNKLLNKGNIIEVNLLTQTIVNATLFKLFPKANVNYFEHGQGDYFFIQNIKSNNFYFYCVFADSFRKYLQSKKQENTYVKNLPDINNFSSLANEVIEFNRNEAGIDNQLNIEGKLVLILMESVQIYNVPDAFWTDYLDLCLSQISNLNEYTFILKPHPLQSVKSLEISKKHLLKTRKLKVLVIENNEAVNYSVEVLYSIWKDNTQYVFSLFSSASYYISKLYGNEKTTFYYAYDFFKKYMDNAPKQFVAIYDGINDVVKNVLTENCIDISRSNYRL